jgi:hypothetical protein
MSCDLKYFFLATPMASSEYMKISYKYFPEDIHKQYNLDTFVHADGFVYCKINKGMYGLKQAAVLTYNKLSTHLSDAGYKPIIGAMGIWTHKVKKINFFLCVDDFGVEYHDKSDAQEFLDLLGRHYNSTMDWTGTHFCGD